MFFKTYSNRIFLFLIHKLISLKIQPKTILETISASLSRYSRFNFYTKNNIIFKTNKNDTK